MTILSEPREIELKLMSNEIREIIDQLETIPYYFFQAMNYNKLVDKLKKYLEEE